LNDLLALNRSKINVLKIQKIQKTLENNILKQNPFVSDLIKAGYKYISLSDTFEF
jgi:hypothetical protein